MLDWICNHIGNERWMEKLQWTGQKAYNDAKFVDWKVGGKAAGYTKAAGNLSVRLLDSHWCPC
jgi:cathepsin A (carboxypeptidase C)